MDVQTVDDSFSRAEEVQWDDFASTGNTRQWEGSLGVAEEAMSLLFILAHLEAPRVHKSLGMLGFTTKHPKSGAAFHPNVQLSRIVDRLQGVSWVGNSCTAHDWR